MREPESKAWLAGISTKFLIRGDLRLRRRLFAEDFVELDPLPGQRQGREGLVEVLGGMLAAFPDIHRVVEEMIVKGGKVVTRFTWTETHRGTFLGIPATGPGVMVKVSLIALSVRS